MIDAVFSFLNKKRLTPKLGRVFRFDAIREAILAQDGGSVDGKIVVQL